MRYGLREIANVMLKAKVDGQKVGNKTFKKGQPVCHFTTLKTSTIEGAATTVYAQGGRGNPRLIAWEGERTLTLTMEDALISPMGIAILTGAGLIESSTEQAIMTHYTENVDADASGAFKTSKVPSTEEAMWYSVLDEEGNPTGDFIEVETPSQTITGVDEGVKSIVVDYYFEEKGANVATHIDIEPGKFGGNYYLEAETLFRDESTGRDDAAEFILPNCRVQSNFTFTMAPTGDPSTFTFTIDAFPGVVKGMGSKKVLCAIQIVNEADTEDAGE